MAGATFGRKGIGAAAPTGRRARVLAPAAFGAAASPVAELERRRDAFIAAERVRSGRNAEADPIETAERAKRQGLPSFPGRKSLGAAYGFWFALWAISAHRFYLGRWVSGIGQTCLWYVSLMFWMAGHNLALYPLVTGLAWIVGDLILIPAMLRATNEARQTKADAAELKAKEERNRAEGEATPEPA